MIVIALRHADRTAGDDLNALGRERADLLARMLGESGVSVAFRSEFVRAQKTVNPLKAKLGDALQVVEVKLDNGDAADYGKAVATQVKALAANAVVAVVGHSDTVGPTIEALGGDPIDPIDHDEFDKLFVLFIAPDASTSLLKLRYGAPTPP